MLNFTFEASDVSRTNQLKITDDVAVMAEKLYLYLYSQGKGIEHFPLNGKITNPDGMPISYQDLHHRIKEEIRNRLIEAGQNPSVTDIHYHVVSAKDGRSVYFLSPNKDHSGWKRFFESDLNAREKIFNLVFKFYLLSQHKEVEEISGSEGMLFINELKLSKDKKSLYVWGQEAYVTYNKFHVLRLNLTRKQRLFLPAKDQYQTVDGGDLGEIILHQDKKYYYNRDLDGRDKNSIYFMRFDDKEGGDLEKFRKTQLYLYQRLMTEMERFLETCGIVPGDQNFQADCYLEKPFVDEEKMDYAKDLRSLTIINNTGVDFTDDDQEFLQNFLNHQGIPDLYFFEHGKTVCEYEKIEGEGEENLWRIYFNIPCSAVRLRTTENYLVFNRTLDEDEGTSMAYKRKEDDLWVASSAIGNKQEVDFYSELKRKYAFVSSGAFYCMQGVNMQRFTPIETQDVQETTILEYLPEKINRDTLLLDAQPFCGEWLLDVHGSILAYLQKQKDHKEWEAFCKRHKVKISPEFQKVLVELGIKSWMREGLANQTLGLPIASQAFSEQSCWAIYVRSPRYGEEKAVAVKFLYKDGKIYIKSVISDKSEIENKFRFLRRRTYSKGTEEAKLMNDQHIFADDDSGVYISYYTDNYFTPILIGRPNLLEDVKADKIKINRTNKGETGSRILPLVMHYNARTSPVNSIANMVCFDLKNKTFIQYFVPPKMGLDRMVKHGFRVYHMIANRYSGAPLTVEEMINHPIVALHFNTLTQNVLRINENSQSSLLMKVARVLVEN